jgi:hypothetical protein
MDRRSPFAAEQAGRNAGFDDTFEDPAEHVALTEPLVTTREDAK